MIHQKKCNVKEMQKHIQFYKNLLIKKIEFRDFIVQSMQIMNNYVTAFIYDDVISTLIPQLDADSYPKMLATENISHRKLSLNFSSQHEQQHHYQESDGGNPFLPYLW